MAEERSVVSPAEAARIKGVSVQAVYRAIREGRLNAARSNGSWYIKMTDLTLWQPRGKWKGQ